MNNTVTTPRQIKYETILKFRMENKITLPECKLLFEAYRRKHLLHADSKFLGLGYPSHYKSKFFTASFQEMPKCNNWYKLTQEGEEMMKKMESYFHLPKQGVKRDILNSYLFNL